MFRRIILFIGFVFLSWLLFAGNRAGIHKVYAFDLKDEIGPSSLRVVQKAFSEAEALGAGLILVRMNTYGGLLDKADSIRSRILHSPIPVYVFIDNNAASAGALIAISCNRIYMRRGASIGAASVVKENGELAPDKYQSYMRSMMRATAESRGRNAEIAQAMVDGHIVVKNVNSPGQVVTFTASEAVRHGFCDGICETDREALRLAGVQDYQLTELRLSWIDRLIGFLIHPAVSGVLIMLILGGIYYEMQAPGLGFPSVVALTAALLYFAPLYLEELALNWEILLFIGGLVLIGLEIFVVPGFGVTGISGITLTVLALVLSLVRNSGLDFSMTGSPELNRALYTVALSLIGFVLFMIFWGGPLLRSPYFRRLVLDNTLHDARSPIHPSAAVIEEGMECIATTDLRPLGKARIGEQTYTVASQGEFIPKGSGLQVIRNEWDRIIVKRKA